MFVAVFDCCLVGQGCNEGEIFREYLPNQLQNEVYLATPGDKPCLIRLDSSVHDRFVIMSFVQRKRLMHEECTHMVIFNKYFVFGIYNVASSVYFHL